MTTVATAVGVVVAARKEAARCGGSRNSCCCCRCRTAAAAASSSAVVVGMVVMVLLVVVVVVRIACAAAAAAVLMVIVAALQATTRCVRVAPAAPCLRLLLSPEALQREQQLFPVQAAIEAAHFAALIDHPMAWHQYQQLVAANGLRHRAAGGRLAIDGHRQFAVGDLLAERYAAQFAPHLQLEVGADHLDGRAEDLEATVEVLDELVLEHQHGLWGAQNKKKQWG